MQEAGVGLDAVEEGAVDVEDVDVVTFGAAAGGLVYCLLEKGKRGKRGGVEEWRGHT